MSTSGIYALNNQSSSKTNPVDIDVESYKGETTSELQDDSQPVLPGQVLSFVPKVANKGCDCYVRVKISYINSDTNFLDYVTAFPDELVKHGEYYYIEPVFTAGRVLELFNTIKIPEDVQSRAPDGNFILEIVAEAIQSEGFEPDYSLEDPWKGVEPEENDGIIYDLDDDTEEDTQDDKVNPKTEDTIDVFVITFIISAIGLIITMILYALENKKISH